MSTTSDDSLIAGGSGKEDVYLQSITVCEKFVVDLCTQIEPI